MSWGTALDLAIKVILWFLGRSKKTEQQKKDFLDFIKKHRDRTNSSVNQQDDVDKQIQDIKNQNKQ